MPQRKKKKEPKLNRNFTEKIIQYNQTICRYCDFLNFLRRHNQIGVRLFSWMDPKRKRWSRGGACCKKKTQKEKEKTHGPLLMLLTSILSINSWWVISLLHNYMTLTYHPIQWSTQWCIPIFFVCQWHILPNPKSIPSLLNGCLIIST